MTYALEETVLEPQEAFTPVFSEYGAPSDHKLRILMIEDVHSDALLTRYALRATEVAHHLTTITRGDNALSTLKIGSICYPYAMPDLIMLDLGLPGVDGFEILAEIAKMPSAIRAIPVVILTAHKHFEYIYNAYPVYVMGYLNKPCDADALRDLLMRIRREKQAGYNS